MSKNDIHTSLVKSVAARFGFDYCGIATAQRLDEDARRLEQWLNKGLHGKMQYMENHFDLRVDPTRLVPGAKSVITLLKNYFPSEELALPLKVSKYAYGEDYHTVIKKSLHAMIFDLRQAIGEFNGRGFVDSAPVLERTWAQKSGLGWIGKNGNLINKGAGSFFFIATLVTDLELVPDEPYVKDYCGSCTRCIDACPTGAIKPNKVVNGNECISYFTIELKEEIIPEEMSGRFKNWMFGCDTCQDVCPWNSFSKPTNEIAFQPLPELFDLSLSDWEEMTQETFNKLFKNSPLMRSKHKGILRNIKFLTVSKSEDPSS